jgi:hypothetical protein
MIHSSHRNPKTKAVAEVLEMIADAHPEIATHYPRPVPLFLLSLFWDPNLRLQTKRGLSRFLVID